MPADKPSTDVTTCDVCGKGRVLPAPCSCPDSLRMYGPKGPRLGRERKETD